MISCAPKKKNTGCNSSWAVNWRTTLAILNSTKEHDLSDFVNELCSVTCEPDQLVNRKPFMNLTDLVLSLCFWCHFWSSTRGCMVRSSVKSSQNVYFCFPQKKGCIKLLVNHMIFFFFSRLNYFSNAQKFLHIKWAHAVSLDIVSHECMLFLCG